MRQFLAVAAVLSLCSCATLANPEYRAQLSSGRIGCMPDEITTTEPVSGAGDGGNWEAECHGKKFICSYELGKHGEVSCAPKI